MTNSRTISARQGVVQTALVTATPSDRGRFGGQCSRALLIT
jgi:hypothetical protein